jgi:hypothetical protein
MQPIICNHPKTVINSERMEVCTLCGMVLSDSEQSWQSTTEPITQCNELNIYTENAHPFPLILLKSPSYKIRSIIYHNNRPLYERRMEKVLKIMYELQISLFLRSHVIYYLRFLCRIIPSHRFYTRCILYSVLSKVEEDLCVSILEKECIFNSERDFKRRVNTISLLLRFLNTGKLDSKEESAKLYRHKYYLERNTGVLCNG